MIAPSSHIIDLRPQVQTHLKKKHSKHVSFRVVFLLVTISILIVSIGAICLEANHLEKQSSNALQLLPGIADNLSTFNWSKAIEQIDTLGNNTFLSGMVGRGMKLIIKDTPLGYHYKVVSLRYSLEDLKQTILLLQNSPVFKTTDQTQSSWDSTYPNLITNVNTIAGEADNLNQKDTAKTWTNLSDKLNKLNQLFGGKQSINYLLVLNDSNQVRPLGGVIGGVVAVTISDWQINYWKAYNASSLDNQISSKIIPPKELQPITTNWTFRQSNWFGDMDLLAQNIIALWSKSNASALFQPDALILFNTQDLKPLDSTLTNLNIDAQTVTNLRSYLDNSLKDYRLSSGPLTDDYLDFVNDGLLPHLTSINGKEWLSILNAYNQNSSENILQKYYFLPWRQASLAKTFNDNQTVSSFFFTNSDLNIPLSNLTSQNLKTSSKLEFLSSPDSHELAWTISLTSTNSTSFNDYVRFYIPSSATIQNVTGFDKYFIPEDPINYTIKKFVIDPLIDNWEKQKVCLDKINYRVLTEGDLKAIAGWLKIKSGQTKTLKFVIDLPLDTKEFVVMPQIAQLTMLQIKNSSLIISPPNLTSYLDKSATLNQKILIQFVP
jgi:hypothetical protein